MGEIERYNPFLGTVYKCKGTLYEPQEEKTKKGMFVCSPNETPLYIVGSLDKIKGTHAKKVKMVDFCGLCAKECKLAKNDNVYRIDEERLFGDFRKTLIYEIKRSGVELDEVLDIIHNPPQRNVPR